MKVDTPDSTPGLKRQEGMIIEHDVAVTMRDGVKIYIDIYRPEKEGNTPFLLLGALMANMVV